MHLFFGRLSLSVFLLAVCAAPSVQASPQEVSRLMGLASDQRCDELAKTINEQLDGAAADVLMFAGAIHEYGPCVRPDWEKATVFYQKAALAGRPSAVPRLIALYAVNLHDPAAALWWAVQRPRMLPKDCIPAADPVKDASAFLEELRTWPAVRLNACTYHAGVMARLAAQTMEYKPFGMSDTVKIDAELNVEKGVIDWFYADEKKVLLSSSPDDVKRPDIMSRNPDDTFMSSLWFQGKATLKEFGKPPSNDPRWTIRNSFSVEQPIRPSRNLIQMQVVQ